MYQVTLTTTVTLEKLDKTKSDILLSAMANLTAGDYTTDIEEFVTEGNV